MCAKWIERSQSDQIIGELPLLQIPGGFKPEVVNHLVAITSIMEFNAELPQTERRRIVREAIFTAAAPSDFTSQKLLAKINQLERDYLNKTLDTFILLTSISIPFDIGLRKRSLPGAYIHFSTQVPKRYKRSFKALVPARYVFTDDLPDNFTIVRVKVQARGVYEAADKAFAALDLLRGIWNITLNINKFAQWSNMELEPVNEIYYGPISTLHDKTGKHLTDYFWYHPDFPRRPSPKSIDIGLLQKNEKHLWQLRKGHLYGDDLDRGLIRYCRALDYINRHMSFIKLWGLIEFLTASERIDEISKRVAFLYSDNQSVRQRLSYLRGYRNDSVHRDIDNQEITELLFQLMHLVEQMLLFHLRNRLKFNSIKDAAEQFLSLPPDSKQLQRQLEIRKYAVNFLTPKNIL